MVAPRDDIVQPIAPVSSERPGMQNYLPMPFNMLGSQASQRHSDEMSGGEDSPKESPSKAGSDPTVATMITSNARLCFERHESTGKMVARLKDAKTGELIRQVPPEEMLKLAEAIDKYLGLLVDRQS